MRQIVLDTETTGLEASLGHRVIEIAAVEIANRRLTGRHFHKYLNPEREIEGGALEVHGLTLEFLQDKSRFREIALEFIEFVSGAELIIHNAPFDVAFLDREFEICSLPGCVAMYGNLVDTLALARDAFPGKRNNLEALCERFGVPNAHRTLHGALLDAQLLAEVYLAMTRGQESLTIDMGAAPIANAAPAVGALMQRLALLVLLPTPEELAAHAAYLEALDLDSRGRCVWLHESMPA
jgi:DNA polymerase III subunit epsilon